MSVDIHKIRRDGGTQSRAAINETTVAEYADAMSNPETVFPPITVYFDGKDYWLADGFHRLAAWERIGRTDIPAEIRQGDRRRAILHSVAANSAHGLRRTNEDKRRAVLTLLEDAEWAANTDQWIADTCRVGRAFVAKLRGPIMPSDSMMGQEPVVRTVTRNGKTYKMNVAKIGSGAAKSRPLTDDEVAVVSAASGETVYLLSTGERVKIGYSRHGARHRVEQLLTGTPLATVIAVAAGTMRDERNVHALLECDRDAGEWFICSVDEGLAAMRAAGLKPFMNTANIGAGSKPGQEKVGTPERAEAADFASGRSAAGTDTSAPEAAAPVVNQEPADPAEAKARRELARLTPEAMIDEVLGLRAALTDERGKRREAEQKAADLKAQIAVFADDHDMGAKLGRALDEIRKVNGRMKEIQTQLARETRRANAMQKARDELQARLEAQIIPMDGAA